MERERAYMRAQELKGKVSNFFSQIRARIGGHEKPAFDALLQELTDHFDQAGTEPADDNAGRPTSDDIEDESTQLYPADRTTDNTPVNPPIVDRPAGEMSDTNNPTRPGVPATKTSTGKKR